MQVKEVMVSDVNIIDCQESVLSAAKKMSERNIGALPVSENDKLVGMVTDRDIVTRMVAMERVPEDTVVAEIMTPGMKYCFEDEDVDHVCDNMKSIGVRRLTVMNRDKRLAGIISIADIEAEMKAA